MRITLNLDPEALAAAMEVSGAKTKTEVIDEALRDYARRRRLRGLLRFEGQVRWEENLNALRRRSRSTFPRSP
jgi:Arc/MetJ family transcription regulator